MSIFEQASRAQVRFTTPKGSLTVEDLWDLPLTTTRDGAASLDNIAKALSKQIREADTESFVTPATKADEVLKLKLEIVKHVIAVRLEENAVELAKKTKAATKQKLLEVLDRKKNAQLENLSVEEIEATIASL
jgi:hypothetical protein